MQIAVNTNAVDAFNRAAPPLETIQIGGKVFAVFHDYWHLRPYATQRAVVTGQLDCGPSVLFRDCDTGDWFITPDSATSARSFAISYVPFRGKHAVTRRVQLILWMVAMKAKYGVGDIGWPEYEDIMSSFGVTP